MAEQILNDRELLEMAAKACGITLIPYTWNKGTGWDHEGFTEAGKGPDEWNPLEDDGSALRLAVKLNITICRPVSGDNVVHWGTYAMPEDQSDGPKVLDGNDPFAATRRAIVRAAAAIGSAK